MLHAALRLCPMLGGPPGRVAGRAGLALPGVHRLVMLPAYAGSTAGFAMARIGIAGRACRRGGGSGVAAAPARCAGGAPAAAELQEALKSGDGYVFHEADLGRAETSAARTIEASYSAPYLAHATWNR
ncbi:MAG: xanthine dehydrogenase family protein molybdopterin-binding subunit [Ramlibacter sp.]|nr:xanthine dehydrogenase family protein molybdopterin-binding subunit [Ramlibacter sp.]